MASILYSNLENPIIINSKQFLENMSDNDNIFWVFPTARYQRHFERKYLRKYFDTNKLPLDHRISDNFDKFIKDLYNKIVGEKYIFIDHNFQYLLIQEAISKSNLQFYTNITSNSSKYINKFIQVINGILKDGKRDEYFSINDSIFNQKKVNDIESVLNNYHKVKPDNFKDIVDLKNELASTISGNIDINDRIYVFEFFNEFNPSDLKLLKCLIDNKIKVQLILDYDEDIGPEYSILKDSIKELLKLGFKITNSNFENEKRKDHLKKYLFSEHSSNMLDINCSYYVADSIIDEVNKVGIEIKKLVANGTDLADMYIVSRNTEKYAPFFKKIFSEIGIPINISDRPNLYTSIPVANVKYLIDCFRFGFTNNNLINILSSNLLDLFDDDNKPLYSEKRKQAIKAIKYLRNDFISIDKRIENINDIIQNSSSINNQIEFKKEIETLFSVLQYLRSLCSGFKLNNQIEDHILFIKGLINSSNIFNNIINTSKSINKYDNYLRIRNNESNSRSLTTLLSMLDDLEKTHKIIWNDKVISFNDFYEQLLFALENSKYQVKELFDHGVTFTSIEQTRGIEKRVIFVCGLVEGRFPLEYKTDKFIGKELHYKEIIHHKSEKLLFYDILKNSLSFKNNSIYLSYPKSESGVELEESSYLKQLSKICKLNNLDYNTSNYSIHSNDGLIKQLPLKNIQNGLLAKDQLNNNSINFLKTQSDRNLSPSRLNSFVKNPFNYFINYIINARSEDEYTLELNRLEKGNFTHHILNLFFHHLLTEQNNYIELNGIKMKYVELQKNDFSKYLSLLKDFAEKAFINFPKNEFTQLELDLLASSKYNTMILEEWLINELKYQEYFPDHYPTFFEYSLGKNGTQIDDGINIIGQVDRIDLNLRNNSFNIIDYKTGSFAKDNSYFSFKEFQMSLYSFSLRNKFSSEFDVQFTYNTSFYVKVPSLKGKFLDNYCPILIMDTYDNKILKELNKLSKILSSEKYEKLYEDTILEIRKYQNKVKNGEFGDTGEKNYNLELTREYQYF